MSTGNRWPYAKARKWADQLCERLLPACQRIEIAGSVRREKPECGDLEIVVIPDGQAFNQLLAKWLDEKRITHISPKQRWGEKQKSFTFTTNVGSTVQVDIFICTPYTWGVNFMLRTGSADFSRRMVTPRGDYRKGLMPEQYHFEEARVWLGGTALDTPEEDDIFKLWGIDYILPQLRTDAVEVAFGDVPVVDTAPSTLFTLPPARRRID